MARKTKVTTLGTNYPVPQSREQAASAVAEIGALNREIGRIEAALNDRIAKAKEDAEARAAPLRDRVAASTEGLRIWAEANRADLTNGGKVKTADLGTGTLSWRTLPPKVRLPGKPEAITALIDRLKSMGLQRLIRTSEEVSKEAILAEPVLVATVPEIKVGSAGEAFSVEPFEVALSGGPANV